MTITFQARWSSLRISSNSNDAASALRSGRRQRRVGGPHDDAPVLQREVDGAHRRDAGRPGTAIRPTPPRSSRRMQSWRVRTVKPHDVRNSAAGTMESLRHREASSRKGPQPQRSGPNQASLELPSLPALRDAGPGVIRAATRATGSSGSFSLVLGTTLATANGSRAGAVPRTPVARR